ncbi:DMT family transporter [Fulvivirga sp. M361]|uniref:DMT family transporter n=1 Tax=Fulvivirga sp. M361 TaxID=2594266 RepID=UPI00117B4893|nr:DMT family transporter [Fulvivirga sp. M361]TRX61475.1 DMT family transporter [Fulvivirga sp. M361]
MPAKYKVHFALFTVALLYGANYTIAKIALPAYIGPFGFIVLRIAIATALFWSISAFKPAELIAKEDFWKLVQCAFFGAAANMLCFFQGLSLTNPINASVIMTLTPIAVLVTANVLGQEKFTRPKILGVSVGAVGAFLLVTKDGFTFESGTLIGDLFILLNASFFAVYLVVVKPLMLKYKPLTVIKWAFLIGMFMCLPFGGYELSIVEWSTLPFQAWMSVFYVIIGATFSVYLLNTWALQHVNASVVGTYIYLQPVIATVIAITFRNDSLDIKTIIYAVFIMSGVYLVSKKTALQK